MDESVGWPDDGVTSTMSRPPHFWSQSVLWVGLLLAAAGGAVGAETASLAPAHSWKTPAGWDMLTASRFSVPPGLEYSEVRVMAGDDSRWAQSGYADGGWKVLPFGREVPVHTGIFWLRFWVRLPALSPPMKIRLVLNGAYDLYWDGELIGRSGRPGNTREAETPGMLANEFELPATALAAGEHVVALRMSSYGFLFPEPWAKFIAHLAAPREFDEARVRSVALPTMAVGALLVLALASLIIWPLTGRPRSWLLFAGLCFCAALSQAAAGIFGASNVLYPWQYPLFLGHMICLGIFGVLLVATVVDQFQVSRGKWIVAVFLAAATTTIVVGRTFPSRTIQALLFTAFLTALGCTLAAIRRGRRDALPAAVGLAGSLAWVIWAAWARRAYEGLTFLPGFLPTVLGFVGAFGWRWSDERRSAEGAKLTAARLEIELLRKQLQPHFLMNTLTALAQAMEENPAGAARLIDDLAMETRMLARMAGEKLVPLAQELELCRAHLRVMSVRTEIPWRIEAVDLDLAAPVPPALFLTLIENGFSHQQAAAGATTFTLHAVTTVTLHSGAAESKTRYRFFSPGEVQAGADRNPGGTGLRYIKARLEESFPGGWAFAQSAVPGGWETVVELRAPATREVGA
jgi:hypothetical protein